MTKKKPDPVIKAILKEYNEDVKRHMGVLSEDFQDQIKVIGEQYDDIKTTLKSHTEMIGSLAENLEIVKMDIEFIKGGLKKKVDYEEFEALEKRLILVEAKLRK